MRTSAVIGLALVGLAAACSNEPGTNEPSAGSDTDLQLSRGAPDRTGSSGSVYVLSNDPAANAVLVFTRAGDGRLSAPTSVATGGRGTGAGLGNQGAIALTENGDRLYAVNAGSDEISVFAVQDGSLRLLQRIASEGNQPISVAVHGDLVYVLNDGATANITGFRVAGSGRLNPVRQSTRGRSAPAGSVDGGQISFSPDGRALIVTEKAANLVVTYPVLPSGRTGEPIVHQSSGATPFGFAVAQRGTVIVSEAAGSTVSSYLVDRGGRLNIVSSSLGAGQAAPCWVALTADGRFAYVANTGSGTVTGLAVAGSGAITLNGGGVSGTTGAGSAPADLAVSPGDGFLYVRTGGNRTVSVFRIAEGGGLTFVEAVGGLPAGTTGLGIS